MSTLSVLMPNFNHARYLSRAIEAIITQSRPPDEFIICDDGSSDDSAKIIESYALNHKCIRFVRNEKNLGFFPTWRRLMAMSNGDYIYPAASDDYVLPGFFEEAYRASQEFPDAGILCGDVNTVDTDGKTVWDEGFRTFLPRGYLSPREVLAKVCSPDAMSVFAGTGTIFKKTVRIEVGDYRSELGHWCDSFAILAAALKYGAVFLAMPVAAWTRNPGGMSQMQFRSAVVPLDIVGRAAWLMRSAEFRDRFPEEYVARWEQRFRSHLINLNVTQFEKRQFERVDPWVLRLYQKNGLRRKISYALDFGARRWVRFRTDRYRSKLVNHVPDLSCYGINQ